MPGMSTEGQRTESTIIHLIGSPGVGKYTIAREIVHKTGARLVDNHAIANVIFNVVAPDGVTPLPPEIWPRVAQVRYAVIDTIMNLAPAHLSYVFTNWIRGESESEYAIFLEFVSVAEHRNAIYVPVMLSCTTDEVRRRIVGSDRKKRLKLVDPVLGAEMNEGPPFQTDHPNAMSLDVTSVPAADAAAQILAHVEGCRRS
jgi:hypothetical protein